ncbi:MAG TPA: ABC transporter permease [Anaerolineae bacterium]|nr:ABC transporter permease [Anaerolineae bacterium]
MRIDFLVRRLLQALLVLWAVSFLTFGLLHLSGDPAVLMAGENWTKEEVEDLRHRMGLDRPWYEQYGRYLLRVVQGDFGLSIRQNRPVMDLVAERLPATLQLTLTAQIVSIVIAIPVGVLSATRRNSVIDQVTMGAAVLAQALPIFWLGIMLILVFSVKLRWTPVAGRGDLLSLVLPVVTLSTLYVASNARLVRSSLLEVLGHDYIRTARAKGLREWAILYRHALRNSLIPVVTMLGLQFGHLLSGAVVTETVFAWPGTGRLIIQAVLARDLPLVQGAVTVVAAFVVFATLLIDLLYGVLDPRAQVTR